MNNGSCYPDKAPEINKLLGTLSHHVRREIIHYFENCIETDTTTYDELLAHLHNQLPGSFGEKLEVKLVHIHLPKLTGQWWIDYDERTNEVRYYGHGSAASRLRELYALFGSPEQLTNDE